MEMASLTMSVPNIITSSPSGGRFDFDDGGTYCGGWQDGKAHGHGVCTGPKNVGEYSGSWNFGFEMSGVYKWTNGAVYEGRWQNGKRHGVGVEYNGKWIYKGEWSQGLKGRYGVKASSNSAVKYEGTWANGLQDGYGSETYSDGGYYQGQMCRGLRHGYGVRKSAPYGDSQLNNPSKNGPLTGGPSASSMLLHSNSLQSAGSASDLLPGGGTSLFSSDHFNGDANADDSPKPEDGFKPNIDRTLVSKNGFVLVSKPLDVPMSHGNKAIDSSSLSGGGGGGSHLLSPLSSSKRRNSLTNKISARIPANQATATLLRGLRLKKQKSTSDLDAIGGSGGRLSRTNANITNNHQTTQQQQQDSHDMPIIPFTLSPEELDITDPTTVETYTGEWKHDKRNGHGVCDRSDGLRYEGQWHNDMKCGYGVTTFKDGTKEEGKYKNNILIVDSKVKRFFQLGGSNIRQRIDDAVKMAHQAQTMALKKAEIADTRAATARDKADQAMTAAIEADRDSQIAYSVARQYSDTQLQLQQHQHQFNLAMHNPTHQNMFQQQATIHLHEQQPAYMQSLNMGASSLQMRRISQHQQRLLNQQQQQLEQANNFQNNHNNNNTFNSHLAQNNTNDNKQQIDQQQQQQQQDSQQFLGPTPLEPFNGRRGSFRGGSYQPQAGGMKTSRQPSHHFHLGGARTGSRNQQPLNADPFGDLFDHYKSTASGNGQARNGRRAMLNKQTSLDYSHMRNTSVPRQFGAANYTTGAEHMRMRRFRMSSLDHADEQHREYDESFEQQFRHLVTSGEELNQNTSGGDSHYGAHSQSNNPTPSDSFATTTTAAGTTATSAYAIAGQSATGSSSVYNISAHQTPSPAQTMADDQNISNARQATTTTTTNRTIGGQAQHASYYNQRDVHSLADEHELYVTATSRRRARDFDQQLVSGGGGRGEFANYDFSITSAPRPAERCMRRTASLSRADGINQEPHINTTSGSSLLRHSTQLAATTTTIEPNKQPTLSTSNKFHTTTNKQQQPVISISPSANIYAAASSTAQLPNNFITHTNASNESQRHLTTPCSDCNSSASSAASSVLNRKPSLQVRYDPLLFGGLMSREEVAALSHAQREQKRAQAELAEQRAKRPVLHLFLSLKEFVLQHQLVICVLIVNMCLMKMFADLIV